jgi:hypothetical protein
MANNVSSNNLTSLYGGTGFSVLPTTVTPVSEGSVSSKNLTTLYSGAVPTGTTPSGNGGGNSNTANYANFAGTAFGLLSPVTNVHISGGTNGYVLQTDGTGNLNWTAQSGGGGNGSPGGANTQIQYNDNGLFGGNVGFTFNEVTGNVAIPGNLSVNGNIYGNVTSALFANYANYTNIANTANSVNVANVVGIGNIAVLNLDGNASNILYGNGVFATVPNTAVANFANYAGNVTVSAQPNITSVGTLSNLSVSGNITSGNANLGNLALANYFSGNGSLLTGVISTGGNSNFANFAGNVTNSAQPNITSVGTLTSLSVTGTVTSGNVNTPTVYSQGMQMQGYDYVQMQYSNGVALPVSPYDIGVGSWFYLDPAGGVFQSNTTGTLQTVTLDNNGNVSASGNISANYYIGNGSLLTGIVATTGNANYANFAGQVVDATQSNITAVGTLVNLSVSGNITSGNANLGNLAIANYFSGNGSLLTGIIATSGNANYANYAGNVTIGGQPNITSVGNLVDLRVENNSIHLGTNAAATTAAANSINIGYQAGATGNSSATRTVAIGFNAANLSQGDSAIAIGRASGQNTQGANSVAIGFSAAGNQQGVNSVAIGIAAGNTVQLASSVAVGAYAGRLNQGSNSIAIGANAGYTSQANNSIILNATGVNLDFTTANSFVVKPVRNVITGNVMFYDNSTGEITYDVLGNASVGNANFANYAGNVTNSAQPNITSVGTLISLDVTGNISSGNANLGNATTSNYFIGSGSNLSNIQGSNVTGNVTSAITANFANYAGNVTNAAQPNITSVGTLSNLSVSGNITSGNANLGNFVVANFFSGDGSLLSNINGANVSNVANANFAAYAGNVTVGNQPNITAVGNLVNLNVSGNALIAGNLTVDGNITYINANNLVVEDPIIELGGGPNGAPLTTNDGKDRGTLLHYYTTQPIDAFMGWDNSSNEFAFGSNVTVTSDVVTFNTLGNIKAGNANLGNAVTSNYFIGSGNNLSNIQGANVTGNVTSAITSNFANYAGNVTNSAQPNITSVGTLSNLSVSGNITSGNANLGNLVIANFFSGDGSLLSNINGANVSNVAIANFAAYAGNVTNAAQPNITSVGTLVSLSVSGNITTGNANLGNAVTANYFIGSGNNLSNIQGANVTGNVTSAITANYANFAGNLINGTSNVTIPTANGSILFGVNANANLVSIESAGTLINTYPMLSQNNGLRINSVGRGGNAVGASRIAWGKSRGTIASPLSVQPNDYTAEILTFGHNGAASQTNSVGVIRAVVDSSYTANGANIPLGWQFLVNDTNGGTNNENKTQNFYANGNVSFANAIFGNSLSVSGNVTGANIIGNVAIANFANYAGNVTVSAQPNITSTGNLISLNINNGNIVLPTTQIQPNGIVVGSTANLLLQPNSLSVITDYGNGQGDGNLALTKSTSFVKARGDSATPTAASTGDIIDRENHYSYNGTSNVLHTVVRTTVGNTNANANAIYGGGTFRVDTGNPFGDTGNANAVSGINSFTMDQYGRLVMTQGTAPTGVTNGIIVMNVYGGSPGPNVATSPGIVFNRYRGNRDSNLSLQGGDQTGRIIFIGANNTNTTFNTRVAQMAGVVDSSYVANTANIPQGLAFTVCDNTNSYTHNFYANSNVVFATSSTVTANGGFSTTGNINAGNISTGNVSVTGNVNATYVVATQDITANGAVVGNTYIGTLGNVSIWDNLSGQGAFARFYGNMQIGNSVTSSKLEIYGNKSTTSGLTIRDGQYRVISDNVNPFTGFSPLSFGAWNNANATIPSNRFFRARGTEANSQPVVTNDQIMTTSYGVYADSGNTYLDTFNEYVYVTGNDGAGNVTANYQIRAFNTGSAIELKASNVTSNANISTSANLVADKIFSNSYIQANSYVQAVNLNANANLTVGNGAVSSIVYLTGNKTTSSFVSLNDTQFKVTMDGVNPTTGFSPFFFSVFDSAYTQVPPSYMYRARGSVASPSAVASGDEVFNTSYLVYADSGNTYSQVFNQKVVITGNDGVGNVTGNMNFTTFNTGSNINLSASNTYANIFTASYLKGDGSNISNIAGANITGQVANALVAGTVYTNAQPNITSVGTLSSLSVSGNITSGNIAGGNLVSANYLSGNLVGNTNIANLQLVKFQETVVSGGTVSGTLTPNSSAGTIYTYTLNGNITLNSLGNAVSGTSMTIVLTQDGTGNRILSSTMKFAGGLKTLSTNASATDIISVFYDGSTYYATLSRGYA